MKRLLLTFSAVAALGGALAACETATPYQPLAPGNAEAGGYSDVRLDATHWRVSFRGNDLTSRETVERYLLYRAADLTVNQGFDWFVTDDKQTDTKRTAYFDPEFGYGWRPSWRYGYASGWGPWGYWGGGPWGGPWGPAQIEEYKRYEVSAQIAMGHGAPPARALDAHQVLTNLGPSILRPQAPK
jgi:hypothetical protein